MSNNTPTILVVEDEQLLLDAITKKLELNNTKVIACKSGEEAMSILKQNDLPDAIWLDYYLKDMNGLEFMCSLKKDARCANIPTIVVSNSASDDKVKSMLALGIKKYYLKAENRLEDIISAIKDLINQ